MSKSIAPLSIPFAAAATIGETRRAKEALPMRLPISSTLRNPRQQKSLQRHEIMFPTARAHVSQSLPCAKNLPICRNPEYRLGERVCCSWFE
jgi:hypothetical protein